MMPHHTGCSTPHGARAFVAFRAQIKGSNVKSLGAAVVHVPGEMMLEMMALSHR